MTWVVLFSPSSENATFNILAPFVAWALAEALTRPRAWVGGAWLLASLLLMGVATTDASGPLRHFFREYCATTWGALMFQVWLVADLGRRRGDVLPEVVEARPVRSAERLDDATGRSLTSSPA
ncbi:hypothetical protein [Frigoriglobus tundricola]|uniref:Uncharacterized protein n=1 Tax=Frigoriglobus tundricola TaxID=2774151 RepID=A0A6M5YUS0_9BACT|nr:hypothetical protein [Frigoriglobus tundricola]QJW97788.1 hypothetical protein FTUN_5368 [Frigoriglobus tundricola]